MPAKENDMSTTRNSRKSKSNATAAASVPNENATDLASEFIVDQDFNSALGVEQAVGAVELRKPAKHEWVRVMPGVGYPMFLLKAGPSREDEYLITQVVARTVPEDCKPVMLRVAVNSANHVFLWPVAVPDQLKPHSAHIAAKACAETAEEKWMRMLWNGSGYTVTTATASMPEPKFPEDPMAVVNSALAVKGIKDPDHEVIRRMIYGG
jgi:hypothetical protein